MRVNEGDCAWSNSKEMDSEWGGGTKQYVHMAAPFKYYIFHHRAPLFCSGFCSHVNCLFRSLPDIFIRRKRKMPQVREEKISVMKWSWWGLLGIASAFLQAEQFLCVVDKNIKLHVYGPWNRSRILECCFWLLVCVGLWTSLMKFLQKARSTMGIIWSAVTTRWETGH